MKVESFGRDVSTHEKPDWGVSDKPIPERCEIDFSECSECHVPLSLNDGCEWGTHALCYGCMEDELTKAEAKVRELEQALRVSNKCLSELLCWVYPWKTSRRSKEYVEEAMRGYIIIGRKHPFKNVERLEKKLAAGHVANKAVKS